MSKKTKKPITQKVQGSPFKMKGSPFKLNPYAQTTLKTPKVDIMGDKKDKDKEGKPDDNSNGDNGSPFKYYTQTRVKYNPKLNPVNIGNGGGGGIPTDGEEGDGGIGTEKVEEVKPDTDVDVEETDTDVEVETDNVDISGSATGGGGFGFRMKGSPFKRHDGSNTPHPGQDGDIVDPNTIVVNNNTSEPSTITDVRLNPDGGDISAFTGTADSGYQGPKMPEDEWNALSAEEKRKMNAAVGANEQGVIPGEGTYTPIGGAGEGSAGKPPVKGEEGGYVDQIDKYDYRRMHSKTDIDKRNEKGDLRTLISGHKAYIRNPEKYGYKETDVKRLKEELALYRRQLKSPTSVKDKYVDGDPSKGYKAAWRAANITGTSYSVRDNVKPIHNMDQLTDQPDTAGTPPVAPVELNNVTLTKLNSLDRKSPEYKSFIGNVTAVTGGADFLKKHGHGSPFKSAVMSVDTNKIAKEHGSPYKMGGYGHKHKK